MRVVELSDVGKRIEALEPVDSEQLPGDDATLARLGKKSVLKRNFGFFTILGFSCTVLITWEAILNVFLVGLQNGGPSGLVYGYLIAWAGTLSLFATLSELVSMAPTSGGQYHWVSMLAPPSCRKFLGYITAWLSLTGWQALVASGAYLTSALVQGLIILTHPSYLATMQNWHSTLLFWAVILFSASINICIGSVLAKFQGIVLVIHILGFFAIILSITLIGQPLNSEAVWHTWLNLGGWPTQGLSFSIGIIGNVLAFGGADGAIHMSEEIRNAPIVIPRSLLIGLITNGTLGFAMTVVTLYYIGDVATALAENPIQPFMAIFRNALHSTPAAAVLSAIPVFMGFSAMTGIVASTSRVYWAFSRDRGLPGWRFLQRVDSRTSVPLYSVLTTSIIAIILSLVTLGGSTAFNGVVSISIPGLFGSYLIAASLLLYRRISGDIVDPCLQSSETLGLGNTTGLTLTWGVWRIPGIWGILNNFLSCAFLLYFLFFSFWPPFVQVTPQNMNWSILVTGVAMIFSTVYYLLWARNVYTGPIIEIVPSLVNGAH
ncbi:amino acid/polyamine transporter I [Hypoxylon argillaceum]|nr:amino acid/polyamine transporter I [Hypoxylon argillaceum]KAI1152536.1 amino acid/polyamine transporter I [Nemania diffusa]